MADDGLEDPRLGRRIIAATRLHRNELRVERAINKALRIHEDKARHALSTQHLTAAAPPDAFDLSSWDTSVDDLVLPTIRDVLEDTTKHVFNFLALPTDVRNQLLGEIDTDAVAEKFVRVVRTIGPQTAQRVLDELSVGINRGESIDKLTKRLSSQFQIAENNGERIARTETHNAAEETTWTSAGAIHENGTPLVKDWLASGGARPTHAQAEADNVGIPYDQPFICGGYECNVPGDTGVAEEDINCRCSVVYRPADT